MAKVDQNTYVEPVSTTAIATARTQQNRSYRSLLANFSSNVEPSITDENIVVSGSAIAPPDGTLFHLANANTSALYVHDERSSMFTKNANHPLSGTKFTRLGIQRAENSFASLKANSIFYEVGESVTVYDSSNARIYIAKSDSAGMAKFVDAGIPPTNGSVTNTMLGLGTAGGAHGVTADRMNVAWEVNSGGVGDANITLKLQSFLGSGGSSGRTGNVSLGFNTQNSVHNAAIVYYGAGTGAGVGNKYGLRVVDKTGANLAPFAANVVMQSVVGASSTTAAANDVAPLIPVGSIIGWPETAAPTGWLIADGTAVNRTVYAGLFALIGTDYGGGDGTTTYNLPDFQDRVAIGKGANNAVAAAQSRLRASSKLITDSGQASLTLAAQSVAQSAKDSSTVNVAQSGSVTGGGHTHTATVPSLCINYIIKT